MPTKTTLIRAAPSSRFHCLLLWVFAAAGAALGGGDQPHAGLGARADRQQRYSGGGEKDTDWGGGAMEVTHTPPGGAEQHNRPWGTPPTRVSCKTLFFFFFVSLSFFVLPLCVCVAADELSGFKLTRSSDQVNLLPVWEGGGPGPDRGRWLLPQSPTVGFHCISVRPAERMLRPLMYGPTWQHPPVWKIYGNVFLSFSLSVMYD